MADFDKLLVGRVKAAYEALGIRPAKVFCMDGNGTAHDPATAVAIHEKGFDYTRYRAVKTPQESMDMLAETLSVPMDYLTGFAIAVGYQWQMTPEAVSDLTGLKRVGWDDGMKVAEALTL